MKNFNELQNMERRMSIFEVMETPEIVVQEERGVQLFSALLKARNPEWGETKTQFTKDVAKYFKENPLSSEIIEIIDEFQRYNVDEETLYNFALTYQCPKRADQVFTLVEKYKPHVKNPREVYQKFLVILGAFDQIFTNSLLANKFNIIMQQDKSIRLERIPETRERIENIIDFFRPNSRTTDVQKINFVPTDPLYKQNSGRAFLVFSGECTIISHIDNVDNQDHEFCHSIINPIVEKLSQKLTITQKEKIVQLASSKRKADYGDHYFGLLCEEFVRTYNDIVKKTTALETYEDFKQKLSGITDDQFEEVVLEDGGTQQRCDSLNIVTISDLRKKSKEYFDKFEKNLLQESLFKLYNKYKNRQNKELENFEQFVLANFNKYF